MNKLHLYAFGRRRISPFDRSGGFVVMTDVTKDFSSEIIDGGKDASPDDMPLNFCEPDFDLVKPGRVGGCKMNAELRVIGQKVVDEFGFMGRKIIRDDMDLASAGLGGHYSPQTRCSYGVERSGQGFRRFWYQGQHKGTGFRGGNTQNHEPRPCLEKEAEQDPGGPRLG